MAIDNPEWRSEVEGAVEFLSLIDADDRLLYVNHVNTEDIFGMSVYDFISAEYQDLARDSIRAARASGYPQHYDSEAIGPEGDQAFYSNWLLPILDPHVDGVVAFVATDVTALRRMESELVRSDNTFSSLIEQIPDHILIADRNRNVTFVNHLEHGHELTEVIGHPIEKFVSQADRDRVITEFESVLETGERTKYETAVSTPTGDLVFETRAGPILVDGQVEGVVMVSTDITDRLEAEREREQLNAQLQQSQKMEALGQLTGGVAHDFNNLLTAVGGNLSLIEGELIPGSAAATRLREAMRAIDQAADLTKRLLVFARDQPLDSRPERIDLLIDGMLPLLERTLGETIEVQVTHTEPPWHCVIDQGQLEQAVLNLAVNARDAMRSGGVLGIDVKNITRTDTNTAHVEERVMLVVRDTGIGMDPEVLNQAIEPFFTTKAPGDGTGLGLSMVYGFVSQSGGTLSLDSQPGVGSEVRLEFPRCPDPKPAQSQRPLPVMPRGNGEVVLVVEDQPRVREVCVLSLEQLGYITLEANSAAEAFVALGKRDDIAAVLTDFGLPGEMNGIELARQVGKVDPPIPVVLMSGYAEPALAGGDLPDGVRFLRKPFKIAELAESVADSLGGRGSGPQPSCKSRR